MKTVKIVAVILAWIIALAAWVISVGFSEKKQKEIVCKRVSVELDNDNFFLEKEDVLNLIGGKNAGFIGEPVHLISIKEIEQKLKWNPYIKKADVYAGVDGELTINVVQKLPLVRFINISGEHFYVDAQGLKIPLSSNFTPNVLVVHGKITESSDFRSKLKFPISQDLLLLAKFISNDDFWNAQIEEVVVKENSDFELIPRVGSHKILLGDISNLDQKFTKLLVFYNQGLNKVGWEKYSIINLKYSNQIVCTKRDSI